MRIVACAVSICIVSIKVWIKSFEEFCLNRGQRDGESTEKSTASQRTTPQDVEIYFPVSSGGQEIHEDRCLRCLHMHRFHQDLDRVGNPIQILMETMHMETAQATILMYFLAP
jgi:hypothetical protein